MKKTTKTTKTTKTKRPRNKITNNNLIYVQHVLAALFKCTIIQEYRFHAVRRWRFDFAIEHLKIAVEIDGGVYTSGRHTRGKGFSGDIIKLNAAALLGWTVYRFTYEQIGNGYFYNFVLLLSETETNTRQQIPEKFRSTFKQN